MEPAPKHAWSTVRDVVLGLAVCILFFASLEAVLRITGIPGQEPGEDPYVGFSAIRPLFTVEYGRAFISPDKCRFFNEASIPVEKGPSTMRIFCFGGSTTYGHPFDGRTAFPRWLQELLKASCPDKDFEVINAGGISYASYRIVPLVREAIQLRTDLVVIYAGHNEFLERRTYARLFEQGRALITLRSLVERLRIYRGLEKLIEPLVFRLRKGQAVSNPTQGKDAVSSVPAAMREAKKTVLKDEVQAILDVSGGLDLYHRDEDFSRGVVAHFSYNLTNIVALCKKAGVPVVLIEPESNLKDFSPFKSEHGAEVEPAVRAEVERKIDQAASLIREQSFNRALLLLDEATSADPLYAAAHYWRGKALAGMGRYSEAHESFTRAKDLDVCPLRATSTILEEIRKVAREQSTIFIRMKDLVARYLAQVGDRTGIPGNESFLDHVHPVIRGHQMIAEAVLEKIVAAGLVPTSKRLTEEERNSLYSKVMEGLDPSFLALRDLNLAKTLKWAGKKEEAREGLLRVAKALDDHPEVHKMMGGFYLDDRNYDEAVKEYEKAVKLSGNDPMFIFSLAVALYRSGARSKAVEAYRALVDQGVQIPEAYSNLALIYLGEGRTDDAMQTLRVGIEKNPDSGPVTGAMGLALAMSGKPGEGVPWMLRALEIEPGNPYHLYNLAGMYSASGKKAEALRYLDMAVAKGYREAAKIAADPVFQPIRDDPLFRDILVRAR